MALVTATDSDPRTAAGHRDSHDPAEVFRLRGFGTFIGSQYNRQIVALSV
ncbi:MAG: hypothetical protein R6V27_10805 [Balneolaceae bacterium]